MVCLHECDDSGFWCENIPCVHQDPLFCVFSFSKLLPKVGAFPLLRAAAPLGRSHWSMHP